ncbi:MAG: hypothetical protein Q8S21_06645 [Candidatus Paracaedibacteraceae bacterium]|nr:hypothetical protein [Candidatus Paracaedibacteraceae bacterium]
MKKTTLLLFVITTKTFIPSKSHCLEYNFDHHNERSQQRSTGTAAIAYTKTHNPLLSNAVQSPKARTQNRNTSNMSNMSDLTTSSNFCQSREPSAPNSSYFSGEIKFSNSPSTSAENSPTIDKKYNRNRDSFSLSSTEHENLKTLVAKQQKDYHCSQSKRLPQRQALAKNPNLGIKNNKELDILIKEQKKNCPPPVIFDSSIF